MTEIKEEDLMIFGFNGQDNPQYPTQVNSGEIYGTVIKDATPEEEEQFKAELKAFCENGE